jgi:hypothetical protein
VGRGGHPTSRSDPCRARPSRSLPLLLAPPLLLLPLPLEAVPDELAIEGGFFGSSLPHELHENRNSVKPKPIARMPKL